MVLKEFAVLDNEAIDLSDFELSAQDDESEKTRMELGCVRK